MDGRRPTGLLYVNTDVDDPSKQTEYHRWYRDVHFGDVTAPGLFTHAEMFHNARVPTPDGEGMFLAMYECHHTDVHATALEFAEGVVEELFEERRIHAGTVSRAFGVYRRLSISFSTQRPRRSQSLVAVHIDARDPDAADSLREWYSQKHVPETVEPGHCHTGTFLELVDVEPFADVAGPDQPRFLALYESDIGDPVAVAGMLAENHPASLLPEYVRLRGASMFYRAGP